MLFLESKVFLDVIYYLLSRAGFVWSSIHPHFRNINSYVSVCLPLRSVTCECVGRSSFRSTSQIILSTLTACVIGDIMITKVKIDHDRIVEDIDPCVRLVSVVRMSSTRRRSKKSVTMKSPLILDCEGEVCMYEWSDAWRYRRAARFIVFLGLSNTFYWDFRGDHWWEGIRQLLGIPAMGSWHCSSVGWILLWIR